MRANRSGEVDIKRENKQANKMKKKKITKLNTDILQRENGYFQTFGNFRYYTVLHKVRQLYFFLNCHSI